MILSVLLWILALLLIAAGFAGLVLPGLPGTPLLFLGLLAAAWAEGFTHVGWRTVLLLGLMAAASYVVELAAAAGAGGFGASWGGVGGAVAGLAVGVFFGIPGVILGPFIGAVAGELAHGRAPAAAGRAGFGAVVGLAIGIAAKLAIGAAMVGLFLIVRFWP